jgi:hypothetical protein
MLIKPSISKRPPRYILGGFSYVIKLTGFRDSKLGSVLVTAALYLDLVLGLAGQSLGFLLEFGDQYLVR